MLDRKTGRRLSPALQEKLIAGSRKIAKREETGAFADEKKEIIDSARARKAKPATTFDDLEGMEVIKIHKDLGAMLGIESPFYRVHGARAGTAATIDGHPTVNFTSYDYLSLNGDERITNAVAQAAAEWGTSVSASRLTSGERPSHRALEGEIARVYQTEAALVFVSGHATNLAVIGSVTGPPDLIVHDVLSHNSIVLGAQLSGATRMSFAHNNLDALEALLQRHRREYRRCLIVTEGLFSMDGDGPDLARLVEIKERHDSWLMVDEAHSLGVLGARGLGIFEHFGVDPSLVDIWMGTLSKTLVSCGGYVAGSAKLIEYLKFHAPGMVYSVGIPATAAVASLTALDIMLSEPERVSKLQRNGAHLKKRAFDAGLNVGSSWGYAVAPVILGDSLLTVLLSDRLIDRGFATVPVFPPGVPEKEARLRLFVASGHEEREIDALIDAINEEKEALQSAGVSLQNISSQVLAGRAAQSASAD